MLSHTLLTAYGWLEDNHLWADVVGFFVEGLLAVAFAWMPWKRHKRVQERIKDLLDTDTPGGLQSVLEAIQLQQRVSDGKDSNVVNDSPDK